MNQMSFTRRAFLQTASAAAAVTTASAFFSIPAFAADPLKIWTIGVAKVGAKDWSAMEKQSGVKLAYISKSARADEAIQKMVVGDGNKLYDAMTDNGGGMEDALASQKAIVPIDVSNIPNWKNVLPRYTEGGEAIDTIRYDGKIYAVPYISNADSLAFNHGEIGEDLAVHFDASSVQTGDESAVGHVVHATRSIDPLDPQTPELAFACSTMVVRVLTCMHHLFVCCAVATTLGPDVTGGLLHYFPVLLPCVHGPFHTSHEGLLFVEQAVDVLGVLTAKG